MALTQQHKNSTGTELLFLDKLGRFSEVDLDRLELLKKYRDSMGRRSNWDNMNPAQIAVYLSELIEKEQIKQIKH